MGSVNLDQTGSGSDIALSSDGTSLLLNGTAVGGGGATFKTFGTDSIMIGDDATGTINAANYNTGLGVDVFAALTSGDNNVAIGYESLKSITSQSQNTAVGYTALKLNTAEMNTAVGAYTLSSNTSGTHNTAMGRLAAEKNTTGNYNTAVGSSALADNTTGTQLTAIGRSALTLNTTGSGNTAVGKDSMLRNTTGAWNTAVGIQALDHQTTASNNTTVGFWSMHQNTTGTNNTALGMSALKENTTASNNTAVGYNSLGSNTTGGNNVAIGTDALYSSTTASENTALGQGALQSSTTATNNTAVGYSASQNSTTAIQNVIVGNEAGKQISTGGFNSIVGAHAGGTITTGQRNAFFGRGSGQLVTTGSKNSIIGAYTGNQNGLDIRTSDNNIVLSDGDGNPRLYINSSGNVGIGTTNPSHKLHVAGVTSGDYLAKIESTNQFGLKIKTTSTSDAHEQFAIHDGNNNVQFKVMGGGTVHATGINLGGSGAANRLDDYEEGTFTPYMYVGNTQLTGGNITYLRQFGIYTKIGRIVHWTAWIEWSGCNSTSSAAAQISLPFNSINNSSYRGTALFSASGINFQNGFFAGQEKSHLNYNTNIMELSFPFLDNGSWTSSGVQGSGLNPYGDLQISGTYMT